MKFLHNHIVNGLCGGEDNKEECGAFVAKWAARKRQQPWKTPPPVGAGAAGGG